MMSTVPSEPAGDETMSEVEPIAIIPVPGFEPKSTEVTLLRFVPVIVTLVPPEVDPPLGETEVIVGVPAGGGVEPL